MKNAPREIQGYLNNLRSELYGEREYFKKAMRQVRSRSKSNPRSHVDCGPLKLLNDSVRHLMQDFKRLEEPFLEDSPEEEDKDVEKSEENSYRVRYATMDFRHRYIWLKSKNNIITLSDQVNRIQTRRIAFDTNTIVQYTAPIDTHEECNTKRPSGRFMTWKRDLKIWMIDYGILRSISWVRSSRMVKFMSGGDIAIHSFLVTSWLNYVPQGSVE